MWDLPGPGLEPMSPALAGGFLTTAPPGKSQDLTLYYVYLLSFSPNGYAGKMFNILAKCLTFSSLKTVETERGPVGLPGMEAFLTPTSCSQDTSLHDLP